MVEGDFATVKNRTIETDITHNMVVNRGSELLSYKIELRNRVTKNEVTLRVTNSKMFTEILLSCY